MLGLLFLQAWYDATIENRTILAEQMFGMEISKVDEIVARLERQYQMINQVKK
jgi:hypothetical protein